jgi:2-dehydro-3-deoxyphosphooctonate aldolase (KDO 8-P synthase)
MSNIINTGSVSFGGDDLPIIAGPCVIESKDHSLFMADAIAKICTKVGMQFVFKSSFDKANRSAVGSFRGPNIDAGLRVLSDVKNEVGVPVLTDVHLPDQCTSVGEVVDVLQIPAFLCRQTDLLIAAGETGKLVNIKKGQFLAPGKMIHAIEKVKSTGNDNILLTERGASFGYDLVSDMTSIPTMQSLGHPVIFDATHSAQIPGVGLDNRIKVKHIMQSIEHVATVTKDDTLRNVVLEMTKNPQGAAVVLSKDSILLGIITEGDLRRCMMSDCNFDTMKVREVMTPNPAAIDLEAQAKDTVALMERRQSQISVLPVINKKNDCCVGLLRLHDIFQTGGQRDMIPTLTRAAVAAGADGIFMEVHDNVEAAKSDAATQWPLDQLEELLVSIKRIREAVCG